MQESQEAGKRPRGVTSRQQAARSSGGAKKSKRPTARIQLHLGAETVKRLGVHSALCSRDKSREADRILRSYLAHRGQGRELFPPLPKEEEEDPGELPDMGNIVGLDAA